MEELEESCLLSSALRSRSCRCLCHGSEKFSLQPGLQSSLYHFQ